MSGPIMIDDDLLRRGFAASGECPRPELFLERESNALPAAERERNERHAESCPSCAIERDLARSFDSPDARPEDLDYVVGRLRDQAAWVPPAQPRGLPGVRHLPAWSLAVAALLVVGVLGILLPTGPQVPDLPAFGGGAVTRGAHLDVIQPVGDLDASPASLSWRAVSEARSYRVRLMRVDDSLLWEASVGGSSVDLTSAVADQLKPRVAYLWQVEALNESGTRIALSDRTRFRVLPVATADPDGAATENPNRRQEVRP